MRELKSFVHCTCSFSSEPEAQRTELVATKSTAQWLWKKLQFNDVMFLCEQKHECAYTFQIQHICHSLRYLVDHITCYLPKGMYKWSRELIVSRHSIYWKTFIKKYYCIIIDTCPYLVSTHTQIGAILSLAQPLWKDDTQTCEVFHIFQMSHLCNGLLLTG